MQQRKTRFIEQDVVRTILPLSIPASQYLPSASADASVWERCMASFLQYMYDRSHSMQTVRIYYRTLQAFFAIPNEDESPRHPEEYTREDVEVFLHRPSASMRNRGKPPSIATINQRLAVLSAFYRFAGMFTVEGKNGRPVPLLQTSSPTLGIRYGTPSKVYRAFSDEELDRFFAVIPTDTVKGLRDRAIFLLYFWTARRREEIARLRWGDLENSTIADERGQRRQGWMYRFYGKGKGEQEDRAELPLPAKQAIDRYLIAAGRMQRIQSGDPLFLAIGPVQGGGKPGVTLPKDRYAPLTSHAISHALKTYAKLAGVDVGKLSLHSWRHTAAHQRYAAGEDVRSLQHLLRHSSIATTDIYVRSLMGTADPGASLLESRFANLSSGVVSSEEKASH